MNKSINTNAAMIVMMMMALCFAAQLHDAVASSSLFLRGKGENNNNNSRDLQDEDACSVHVTLTCPTVEPINLGSKCMYPFRSITFKYNGVSGGCAQSDNLHQNFYCWDYLQPSEGIEHYIVVTDALGET